MTANGRDATRGPWSAVELSSAELSATLLPEKGCDVLELVDLESGVDVLLKTPWTPGRRPVHAPGSLEAWIEAYPGGWQLILPNGGDATLEHGVEWGFHGEAGLIAWRVEEAEQMRAAFSAELVTAPLALRRVVSLEGPVLRIEESVRNSADTAIEVMWGHHPALGAPFLEPGCTISAPARGFHADDRAPGDRARPGGRLGVAARRARRRGDARPLGDPSGRGASRRARLSDRLRGGHAIGWPTLGLGLELELRWPLDLFPAAWFWQELHASPGYPWYRRLYTTALEPNSSWPGQGLGERAREGRLAAPARGGRDADGDRGSRASARRPVAT